VKSGAFNRIVLRLSEEFDRDLGRHFPDRVSDFLRGVGKPIGVDIDSDAASATGHAFIRLEEFDGLLEVLSATRTLKPDLM
jgi:hypothetical protein